MNEHNRQVVLMIQRKGENLNVKGNVNYGIRKALRAAQMMSPPKKLQRKVTQRSEVKDLYLLVRQLNQERALLPAPPHPVLLKIVVRLM